MAVGFVLPDLAELHHGIVGGQHMLKPARKQVFPGQWPSAAEDAAASALLIDHHDVAPG